MSTRAAVVAVLLGAACFCVQCALHPEGSLLQSLLKPVPLLALASAQACQRHQRAQFLLYAAADLLLELELTLALGMAAFALGHFVFALVVSARKSKGTPRLHVWTLPGIVAGLTAATANRFATGQCRSSFSALHIALYGASLMCLTSAAAVHSAKAAIGAALFSASDLCIVICMGCATCPEPFRTFLVMALYWTGCVLMFA